MSLNSNNATILSFAWRNSTINPDTGVTYYAMDSMMNARYNGYSLALKGMAFVPCIVVFILFGVFVWIYGRFPKPTKQNPYGGRLRKRRRNKFNARKKWNTFRIWVRGTAPILTRFKKTKEDDTDPEATPGTNGGNSKKVGKQSKREEETMQEVAL